MRDVIKRHVVMGVGNILNRDEGLGVRALHLLETQLGEDVDVEFVDGGVMGLSLLPLVEDCEHLLVLDAIDSGEPPGTFVEMAGPDIRLFSGIKMSQHQLTFQEVLGLAFIRGQLPPNLYLVGAQPADLAIGLEISDAVAATLPRVVDRATEVLAHWGLSPALPQATATE